MNDPQNLKCTITSVNLHYIRVNASWSSPKNAESAALAFYYVAVFNFENLLAEAILNATNPQQNAFYTNLLPVQNQKMYRVSISAENKCGKMSREVVFDCNDEIASSDHPIAIYYSTYIIMYFLYNFIIINLHM